MDDDHRLINEGLPSPAGAESPRAYLRRLTHLAAVAERSARALLDESDELDRVIPGLRGLLGEERGEVLRASCRALDGLIDVLCQAFLDAREPDGVRS